ncbi:MAG TPA: hypothetical protein DEE98_06475 [Elusimicrobia bacterium]|nr:MAG: hypothetical protein A2278_02375 [Elusimicrobia bacterium RIFOXYA12_FULL_49_49]OGS06230.1 MAG: hypothetical protein A2204_02295 [Elusimicrobia bacterium RIFOXYA1_FULL_47_7]OGS11298.1 MAG: hypothetical protein A2386_04670 [Elusimicrobia bacterium RIFOXYB1_FULL_48_9]OGS16893.1 MAG: hypothetical protein A2251_05825 [Elusimicrobia bacterium RIFOXYA2_FULL_47_53]OGS32121.1 MAG: hypothetical protein A2323_08600 [Elusimicrobia bacterium RIFOXYB2_FULL_46_23]HBU70016.1 hypothetical protein [Elus
MSFLKLEEIVCPCGEVFEAELYNAINVNEDPELKESLIAGEVNVVCCPNCREIFYAEHFVLYHDPASELIAFVYPSSFSHQAAHWRDKMEKDFKNAMSELGDTKSIKYEPMLVFGMDTLVEIIKNDDAFNDEVRILEHMAKELELALIKLHPALARPKDMPRVLPKPKASKASERDDFIAGLSCLIKHNQHLSSYRKFLQLLEHDKKWKLDKKLVVSE